MSNVAIFNFLEEIKDKRRRIAEIEAEIIPLKECFEKEAKRLHNVIAQSLYANMTDKQKEEIEKHRERVEIQRNSAAIYALNNEPFDPITDVFEILDVEYKDGKIRFQVECNKNRQYLGGFGPWICDTYYSEWIDEKEL